jgi:RimJ/RimL family protein N-acetyltransferase
MKVDWSQNREYLDKLKEALSSDFYEPVTWAAVVGEGGTLRTIVAFHNFCPASCEISVATFHPRPIDRQVLRELFKYPFEALGLRRIHSVVRTDNAKSLELTAKLGLKVEGYVQHWYPDCDGIFHGMLREDCKWL